MDRSENDLDEYRARLLAHRAHAETGSVLICCSKPKTNVVVDV